MLRLNLDCRSLAFTRLVLSFALLLGASLFVEPTKGSGPLM